MELHMSFIKHIFGKDKLESIQKEDIDKLIEDKVEESQHLDYEEIPIKPKFDGLAKHVSGFLNTSGGVVIFGVSEQKNKIPIKITWSSIRKETVENNLYQRVEPWNENIEIAPIQNPADDSKKIFIIIVPKSKNPPHMANHRYHVRLNFQTRPLGHEQVAAIFRQNYLLKYDLIHTVYGPILSELVSFYDKMKIAEWGANEFRRIKNERLYLLRQDSDLYNDLEDFYYRVNRWNDALKHVRPRLARIINKAAADFFNTTLYERHNESALKLEIKAESLQQISCIDEAILNDEDPIDFWKKENPFAKVLSLKILLESKPNDLTRGDFKNIEIDGKDFAKFKEILTKNVAKDKLISFVRKEFDEMQGYLESSLFGDLENKI